MNILQIAPRLPFPLTDGGAIGIFNITKHLAMRGHSVTLVCFSPPKREPSPELDRWCVVHTVADDTGHGMGKVFPSYFHRVPYQIEKFRSELMMAALMNLCAGQNFDVIHTDHLVMAQYAVALKKAFGLPILLREHNYETTMLERFAMNERNILLRTFVRSEYIRMRTYEADTCRKFDRCAMITQADERRLLQAAPDARTVSIPAGVTIPEPGVGNTEDPSSILFLSSLGWKPNIDGFLWFYREVFPAVLKRVPSAHIVIVGKGDAPDLRAIRDDRVQFVGFVDDVAPSLRRASVCIVPLFTGSGIRIKILEMMAYGKAIVTTSIGCEGIGLQHGETVLIADGHDDFSEAVVRALTDHALRTRLGVQANECAERNYGWPSVAAQFEESYRSILQRTQHS